MRREPNEDNVAMETNAHSARLAILEARAKRRRRRRGDDVHLAFEIAFYQSNMHHEIDHEAIEIDAELTQSYVSGTG
jgi:hypothetical protein